MTSMESVLAHGARIVAPTTAAYLGMRCARHQAFRQRLRCISTSRPASATPVSHPPVAGAPPPAPPEQPATATSERLSRRLAQAEASKPLPGAKPLQKRFWKDVSVQDAGDGRVQVMLDKRPIRTAKKQVLTLPQSKRALAGAIALEWDLLTTAQQALKHHYIPLTSLISRANDIASADAAGDQTIRANVVKMMMKYLSTDTLLCWAPEVDLHDPGNKGKLRDRQRQVAEPIIAHLKTHIFPGVDIEPILDPDSIVPKPHPELTVEVIRGWLTGLPAYELAALERGVLATKSLLIAIRLLVEWSKEFEHARTGGFGVEQAAEAASLEMLHQTEQWGEVEDTHDVDAADIRRQLGSVILLVS